MVSGRKPDLERRRQAARLRSRGLSLREIGQRLGISRQAVFSILQPLPRTAHRMIHCCACGGLIVSAGALSKDRRNTLCTACLPRRPTTFGQRLKAFRLAAGLTRTELAQAAHFDAQTVKAYEEDHRIPHPATRQRLARVLGLTTDCLAPAHFLGRSKP